MTESEFSAGSVIGDFTVLAPCGAGAYGQVYLVRDGRGRRLALKVLSSDRRGERELDGLLRFRRVRHPDLLRVGDLGTLPDGRVYYTMDAADNASGTDGAYEPDTLARRMRANGSIPPAELGRIMLELASGLAELHRAHFIHRDIKPENILFVNGHAVLADAGTVDDAEGASLIGTLEYLPPEVRMGKRGPTASDDCYALGKVLYSALSGEAPQKFPSTPHTLDKEAVALFRVAVRACTPPGVSAYRLLELLEHPERARRLRRSYRLPVAGALLALTALASALTFWPFHEKRPAAPVRTVSAIPAAETPAAPVPATAEPVSKEPAWEELLKKYERTSEERRLVDRWMAESAAWTRKLNRAGATGDKAKVAELAAAMKEKLPYGIAEFCGDEMRMVKLMRTLERDYAPEKREYTERWLKYRRDRLKKLLETLPDSELAKWR